MSFWFDDENRLAAAKDLQHARINFLRQVWSRDRELKLAGFDAGETNIANILDAFEAQIKTAATTTYLLATEAKLTKQLYKIAACNNNMADFVRERQAVDLANILLNHGNYLAYGLAASALWVLGIPHGLAVMHGKTRRGALVFDVADLVKDAIVLPWAFICAGEGAGDQEFRQQCLQSFTDHRSLDYMFKQIKEISLANWGKNGSNGSSSSNSSNGLNKGGPAWP